MKLPPLILTFAALTLAAAILHRGGGFQSPSPATTQPAVSEEEINARLRRLLGRFESKGTMEAAMKSHGIRDEAHLRARTRAQIQEEKLTAQNLASLTQVTEAEAQQWFAENQAALALPERVQARHIFIPTLEIAPEKAHQTLTTALATLTSGAQNFSALAATLSQDPATQHAGGDLGWISHDRIPAAFAASLFSLPLRQPTLIQSELGWHLVEITARKAAEPRTFQQAKPEILAALQALKAAAASRSSFSAGFR